MADRTVSVALVAKVQGFKAGVLTAQKSLHDFGGELDKLGKKSPQRFNDMSMGVGAVGLALAGMAGYAVHAAMTFDKQMSEVAGVSQATGQQMTALRQAALDAGRVTQYSATQAAQAEAELAKAGISTSQILGGALTGAMSLAAAGGLNLADAATLAAQAMNVFQLHGSDVGHIADVLAAGANKSAADVQTLGQALQQGGQVAAQTGLTLEDTVGTLSAFADRALTGSDAGTSLKTMLQKLAAPSTQASDLMRQLGIHTYDANGQFVGITDLAGQLHDKLGDLSQAQRDNALATIFGSDAVRAANVLYGLGRDGLQKYVDAVNDVGAAQDLARQKMNNLSGDVEQLRGSVETFAITSGTGANSGLRDMTQALTRMVNGFMGLPGPVQESLTVLAGVSGVGLLGASGLLKMRQRASEVLDALREMGPVGKNAATVLGKVGAVAGKVALTLAALQAASAMLGHDLDPSVKATADSLTELGKTGKTSGEALSHLNYDLGTLGTDGLTKFGNGVAGTIEGLTGLGTVFDESLTHAKQRITAIDTGLAALVQSGRTDEAAAAFNKLAEQGKKAGISVDDLRKGLPQYQAALDGADKATINSIQHTQQQDLQMRILKQGITAAVNAYGSLEAAINAYNGQAIDSERATIAANQAVDSLTASLKANGTSLDINKAEGQANMSAILDVADAATKAAQAKYAETGSVSDATAVYNYYKQQLVHTLVQMGVNRGEAQKLAEQYMQIPASISTSVNTVGLDTAYGKVISFKQTLDDINGKVYTVYVTEDSSGTKTYHRSTQGYRRLGGVDYAAQGMIANTPTVVFGEAGVDEAFIPSKGISEGRAESLIAATLRWWPQAAANLMGRQSAPMSGPGGAAGRGPGGVVIQQLVIQAYSDRFNLREVYQDLALYGVK